MKLCYVLPGVLFILSFSAAAAEKDWDLLASRLDLDRPGLEEIRAAQDPHAAAAALLDYYRLRRGIVPVFSEAIGDHPHVAVGEREQVRGKLASAFILEIADDAARNILVASLNYPRHDFGSEIDWFTNQSPNQDTQWIAQLHRHIAWTAMGRAYWHNGDEKYAEAYARQLADWIEKVPPNRTDTQAWKMLQVGIRGYNWTAQFFYFLDSPHYTPELLVQHLNSFYDHADFLQNRPFSIKNHALMEAEGMAFIAVLFPEFRDAPVWRRRGIGKLVEEIQVEILPDGMQYEMCFNYHQGVIRWLWRTYELARLNGLESLFPDSYSKTVEKMYEVLGRCAHPNGKMSMFGDDKPDAVRDYVSRGAKEFPDNPTLQFLAHGKGPTPPTAFPLPDAGIYSLRSGWDADAVHFIMKCGRDGFWHSQPDNATFELFAYGKYLMPDSGCYIYHAEGREWFRQTKVHQTITLDGKDSAYAASLLQWKPGSDLDTLVVENQSYPDLKHRRAVFFVRKKFFILVDEAIGTGQGNVDLHFQLAPGEPQVREDQFMVRTDFSEGANLLVRALPQPGMSLDMEEGRVSFKYGSKEPRTAFRYRVNKTSSRLGVRFVTLLYPYLGPMPAAEVTVVGDPPVGASEVKLEVQIGADRIPVGYSLNDAN